MNISLVLRIFIGLIIGAILGFLIPSQQWISIFGDVFVGALKGIAPVLVFVLVASSLANAKGGNADRFKVVFPVHAQYTHRCIRRSMHELHFQSEGSSDRHGERC